MIHALFIDNDLGSQILFEEICRDQGIQYTGIKDPVQIEKHLNHLSTVNVVVLDLEMPHHNGYEVLSKLRSHPNFERLPIAACTVHNNELERAQSAGFNSFIIKPLKLALFAQQLLTISQGGSIWETH
jgi:CheY-like chemotaxis protein